MTLKPIDLIFIVVVSTLCGVGGSFAIRKYMPQEIPPVPKVIVFNSGQWVMDQIARDPSTASDRSPRILRDSAEFTARLADEGFIVLNGDAVLAAPGEVFATPDTPRPGATTTDPSDQEAYQAK